eukprot:186033-Prymnesium_polylepis.1
MPAARSAARRPLRRHAPAAAAPCRGTRSPCTSRAERQSTRPSAPWPLPTAAVAPPPPRACRRPPSRREPPP